MSTLIERAKAQVVEVIEKIDSWDSLESVLNAIGLEITVSSNGSGGVQPKARKSNKAHGVKKMWAKIRKIAKQNNCSIADARKIYLSNKNGNDSSVTTSVASPKRKMSKSSRDLLRKSQNKYWKAVEKIKVQNNCSTAEARKILKRQKAA